MVTGKVVSASHAHQYNYLGSSRHGSSSWFGNTAEMLGLQQGSTVHEHHFVALLAGLDPHTGEQYIKSGYTREGVEAHKAGLDLTFSVSKSVSVLGELSTDEMREKLWGAFNDAVITALQYAESELSQVRQKINGEAVCFDSGNLAVAIFSDTTARPTRGADGSTIPGDMQWHDHTLTMNMSQRESDKKIVALENRQIFQNRKLLDEIFKNELAANIREIGLAIRTDDKGSFEIAGVPTEILQQFSKRREDILEKSQEIKDSAQGNGKTDAEVRQLANLASREKKADFTPAEHDASWEKQLNELGYTREQLLNMALQAGKHSPLQQDLPVHDYVQRAAEAITASEAVFSRAELLKTASKLSSGSYRTSEIKSAISELIQSEKLSPLNAQEKDVAAILTTPDMHLMSLNTIGLVKNGIGTVSSLMPADDASMAITKYEESKRNESPEFKTLTDDQKNAVLGMLTSNDQTILVQGAAGSGKSASFDALRFAMETCNELDMKIIGLAPTGKAASQLQQSASIKSMTIDSYLNSVRDKDNITDGTNLLIIVDEASMVGAKMMHELQKHSSETGARLILSGDTSQLTPIAAGRPFQEMQEVAPVIQLQEVLRQKSEYLKAIRDDVTDKKIDRAFERLETAGKLYELTDRVEAVQKITEIYTRDGEWQERLVITNTNSDRQELNHSIRDELKNMGAIGTEDFAVSVRFPKNIPSAEKHFAASFSEGDRLFANSAGGGLKAGSEFQITGIDTVQNTLVLDDGNGNLKVFDVQRNGQGVSAYSEESKPFSIDEKIVFLKNDWKLGVMNGETASIRNIDHDGNIMVEKSNGEELSFNASSYAYFDHGNAITLTKAQGMTSPDVIFWANSNNERINSSNTLYTAVTRGKFDVHLITDNREALIEQFKTDAEKTSVLDYVPAETMEQSIVTSTDKQTEEISFSIEGLQPDISSQQSIDENSVEHSLFY